MKPAPVEHRSNRKIFRLLLIAIAASGSKGYKKWRVPACLGHNFEPPPPPPGQNVEDTCLGQGHKDTRTQGYKGRKDKDIRTKSRTTTRGKPGRCMRTFGAASRLDDKLHALPYVHGVPAQLLPEVGTGKLAVIQVQGISSGTSALVVRQKVTQKVAASSCLHCTH